MAKETRGTAGEKEGDDVNAANDAPDVLPTPQSASEASVQAQPSSIPTGSVAVIPARTAASVIHPATTKQKVILAALLVAWTIVSLLLSAAALHWVQAVSYQDVEVPWHRKSDVQLETGPVGFRYVSGTGNGHSISKLIFVGPMSDETRKKLAALFPAAATYPSDKLAEYQSDAESYVAAIDTLADESVLLANKYISALLLLGGCCGMVGVQLRSMWDFVRNICFKDPPQLDVVIWWPWYVMRPLIGFVLGMLAISMIMSGFLDLDNQSPRNTLWWLSITALVGFGATEFMGRLRLVVGALFATQG